MIPDPLDSRFPLQGGFSKSLIVSLKPQETEMQQETIQHVQESWKAVKAIAPQAAALFYQNLFEADPSLRLLFRGDLDDQGRKLMQTLGVAVSGLNDLDRLIPALQALAVRHVDYGVEESHYQTVGGALLKTLEMGLGEAFTPEVRVAWATLYGTVASVMIEAAREHEVLVALA